MIIIIKKSIANVEELLCKQKDYLIGLFNSKKAVETINSIEVENSPKTQIKDLIKTLKDANEKLKVQSIEEDLKLLDRMKSIKQEKKRFLILNQN